MSCDHTCILSTDQLAVVARGIRKSSGITVSSKFRLVRYPGRSCASTACALRGIHIRDELDELGRSLTGWTPR